MSLAATTLNQILIIFILIIVGVICYKLKLIDDNTNSKLSNLLLLLVNPAVIFVAYQREFSKDLLQGLLISLVLSLATHLIGIILAYILIKRRRRVKSTTDEVNNTLFIDNNNVEVERLTSIYSNVGFIGIPLVNGIYGSEGVFYVTASLTIFNLFLWTHGVIMMTGGNKVSFKDLLKKLISPSIIAIVAGLICFLLQIKIPEVIHQAFSHIAGLNTPFAMLIAGVTIGKTNILKLFTRGRVYLVAFIKLLLIPLLLLFIFSSFPINEKVFITAIIMAATPSGATGILFAIKYNKNSIMAAEIFTMTTLLCALTIPLIIMIASYII